MWRDESGVALGIAVIMIVLIGVMGAGLLVFVRNDLEAVVEVNQGENALSAASAGVEAAESHLAIEDNSKESYDADTANGDSEWSFNQGKDLNFGGDSARVTIQYLTPSTTEAEARLSDHAPEVDATLPYDNDRRYFKISSRGEAGNAARKIEAIYRTTDFELPPVYYSTGNIDFNGNATSVTDVSLFAKGNVTNVRPENMTGTDLAYGDWTDDPDGGSNDYNATPRGTDAAGVGAVGTITYDPSSEDTDQKDGTASPQRYGTRDFDSNSDQSPISSDEFVENTWGDLANQPADDITFPFPTASAPNDDDIIDALRTRAMAQGNYVTRGSGESFNIEDGTLDEQYPPNSDLETVFFVEFADGPKGNVDYRPDTSNADGYVKGTIVVVNGDLTTSASADPFEGALVIRNTDTTDTETLEYKNAGNQQVKGFANVEGDVTLSGDNNANLSGVLADGIPGLYETEQWSWRECYSEDCS